MTTDDVVLAGKPFIVLFTKGDLPTNPMSLRECVVCGGFFTHEESREHAPADHRHDQDHQRGQRA